MKTIQHTIQDEMGLHARPVGQLVKFLKPFASKVTISTGEKSCDMKGMIALMSLCIKHGTAVTITVEGEDEAACADGLVAFIAENKI